jgi:hypothetical protein
MLLAGVGRFQESVFADRGEEVGVVRRRETDQTLNWSSQRGKGHDYE